MDTVRDKRTECWECIHKRENNFTHHIACAKPSASVGIHGSAHGKRNGWFYYPLLFDPVWKESLCENFEATSNAISPAISLAVSQENSAPKTS